MIITVAHQKGGTGKSTIATNLAVELRTSLLDLDKQHSSIIFNYKRQNAGLTPIDCYSIAESQCRFDGQRPVPEAKLDEFLSLFKGDPETNLVIDVGGFDSPLNRKALFFGDYILTPCAPSGTEIYGLQMFEEILQDAEDIAGIHLMTHVLINNADKRSQKRIAEMQEYVIGKPEHFILCHSVIGQRVSFKTAYEQGRSVIELHKEAKTKKLTHSYMHSAEEMAALCDEIKSAIKKGA